MEGVKAITRIIRRSLATGFSNALAVVSSPPPGAAKKPRRSRSPPQRATSSGSGSGPKNRPGSPSGPKSSAPSAPDLDANPSAQVDATASSTRLTATRRRRLQRQRQRAASKLDHEVIGSDQELSHDIDASNSKGSASDQETLVERDDPKSAVLEQERLPELDDPKSAVLEQERLPELDDPKSAVLEQEHLPELDDPKSAVLEQERLPELDDPKSTSADSTHASPSTELDLDAKNRLAAKKRRHRKNRRERKKAATQAKDISMGQEISAQLDTAIDAPPIGDRDGLHGAALAVAAPSTIQDRNIKNSLPVPPMPEAPAPAVLPRPLRAPAYAPDDRPFQAPAPAPGLLDDIEGQDSFFGKMFDPPDDDDCRARHHRYLEACSSLQIQTDLNWTYCLVCFLRDKKDDLHKVQNKYAEMMRHMRLSHGHKARWNKCKKNGCYVMASKVDIDHHHRHAHQANR